jgi:hypothetical protein
LARGERGTRKLDLRVRFHVGTRVYAIPEDMTPFFESPK